VIVARDMWVIWMKRRSVSVGTWLLSLSSEQDWLDLLWVVYYQLDELDCSSVRVKKEHTEVNTFRTLLLAKSVVKL
jgi:hypothetical protein